MKHKNSSFSVALLRWLVIVLSLVTFCASAAETGMMRQYQMAKAGGGETPVPVIKTVPVPVPAAHEVLVRVRAVSLNHKDLYFLDRDRKSGAVSPGLSISDGAGDVVGVGSDVKGFKVGDRVVATFDKEWIEGEPHGYKPREGMLSELVIVTEDNLLPIPEYLSYADAATLPCAAVTAWTSLFKAAHLHKGDYVLLEGTGGVSVFGLQFAAAAGARPIITSSSDAKLEKARTLGAVATVNYKTHPDWQQDVRAATGGAGVKNVLEIGGKDTLPKAIASLAQGGHIALIGGLSAGGFVRGTPTDLLKPYNARLTHIYVGSRADFAAMNAFMTRHKIKPVIDRVFPFEQAPAAYEYMESGAFFGKIVIAGPMGPGSDLDN
jgi:NADPH:quinone reductase-like Zn-dependent oxidoreductase